MIDHEGGTVVTPRVAFHFLSDDYTENETNYSAGYFSFVNTNMEYQHSQILRNGETLEMIQNPVNKTDPDRYFYGWYIVDYVSESDGTVTYAWTEEPVLIPFGTAISITPDTGLSIGADITWSMGAAGGTGALDGEGNANVYLAPIYEDYYFVNFHLGPKEELGTAEEPGIALSLMTRKLIVLGSDGQASIRIGNIKAESPDPVHKIFTGWETVNTQTTEEGGITQTTLVTKEEYITMDTSGNEIDHPSGGYYITVNEKKDIDLYPVFAEARWVYFNTGKSGNNATYVGAQYLLTSNNADNSTYYFDSLPVSQRNGFEFKGWYLSQDGDENGTGDCITDLSTIDTANKTIGLVSSYIKYAADGTTRLWEIVDGKLYFYKAMDDLTLYAKWEEVANTTYSVIIWKQKVTDEVGLADSAKTYDYVAADSQMDIPGFSGQTLQDLIDANALSPFITTGSNAKYTGFSYARTTMTTDTVAGDKTTVVNVYYDRDVHTLTFRDYTYTVSTNNSANYGYVEGLGYIQLTRNGYAWSYVRYSPVSSPNTRNTYYVLYNGEYYTATYYSGYGWYVSIDGSLYSYTTNASVFGSLLERTTVNYNGTRYTRSSNMQGVFSITALYGQSTSEYFSEGTAPLGTTYLGAIWQDVSTPVYYTQILSSVGSMPEQDVIFNLYGSNTSKAVHYYIESLDQTTPADGTNRRSFSINGSTVLFDHLKTVRLSYNFLTYDEEYHEIDGYDRDDNYSEPYTFYTSGGLHRTSSMDDDNYLYYVRVRKSLTFDVNYPNITGLDYSAGTSSNLTVSNIPYGQSLAQYGQVDGEWYYGTGDNPTNRLYGPANYIFEGWYEDATCTVPFDFSQTMPSGDKIVYAKWTPVNFRININPNGAVIDHSDQSAWGGGSAHYTDKATYINADYGVAITEYPLTREYVPISDSVADTMSANDVYYYMYAQYFDNTGRGLPADLRNALYLTESQLQTYYNYYVATIQAKQADDPDRYNEVTVLGYNAWKNDYVSTQKYRKAYANERYVFLGWYKNSESMPYNFSDPVDGTFTLTARWRLDGGYYFQYIPEYRMPNGVLINGDMSAWRDPEEGATFADQATAVTLQQPTGLTADGAVVEDDSYIFLGWRIVDEKTTVVNGRTVTTYTPLEKDGNGDVIYHREGEAITIDSRYADSNGRICLQAVYEEKESSVRRPHIANLILDANTNGYITADGSTELSVSDNLDKLGDVGIVLLNVDDGAEEIVFGDIQSNISVHLTEYAVEPNYFKHREGYFLLGFDQKTSALAITRLDPQTGADTGVAQPYVPNYPADSVIAVQRTDSERLYAIWEPMVYLNVVNDTGVGPVTFSLSAADASALYVVNVKDGSYSRTPLSNLNNITVNDGDTLMLAIPQGAEKDITISGTNTLGAGQILYWDTKLTVDGTDYDTAVTGTPISYVHNEDTHVLAKGGDVDNNQQFTINEKLIVNKDGLTVTFTAVQHDRTLVLHDNYREVTQEKYFADPLAEESFNLSTPSTRVGYEFVGWDTDRLPDNTSEIPDFPVGTPIGNIKTFFGDEQIKTLYAVWKGKAERGETRIFKVVPEPGNQSKEFTFTASITGQYKRDSNNSDVNLTAANNANENVLSQNLTLTDGQYLLVTTSKGVGQANTNGWPWIQAEIKKYTVGEPDTLEQTVLLRWQSRDSIWGTVTFDGYAFINVVEADYSSDHYSASLEKTGETEADALTLTQAERKVSWTNTDAGGTVIYTNARQTANVTVRKVLAGESTGSFRYNGSYTVDGKTTTLSEFTVNADSFVTLEGIPVDAVLTLTETVNQNYIVETSFANGSADTDSAAETVSFAVPVGGETVTFKNTLKSWPVKIVKVDQAGNIGVEARFDLTQGEASLVSGKYTTPTNNEIYNNPLYVGTYQLTETWVQDGYIGLSTPVTLALTGSGTLTSSSPHAVVSGNTSDGFTVTVYNQATVDVEIAKELNDPLTSPTFTFNVDYAYTLNGESISERKVVIITPGENSTVAVPVGASLTVTELNTYSAYTSYNTTATMEDEDGTEVVNAASDSHAFTAVINKAGTLTFTNTRKEVQVTVRKTVQGDGGSFTFTATVKNNATVLTGYGTDTVPVNGFVAGVQSFTLSPAKDASAEKTLTIPYGAVITLEETPVEGYTTTVDGNETATYTSAAITAPATVEFVNRKSARVTITKQVEGGFGDRRASNAFTFTLVSVYGESDGEYQLTQDGVTRILSAGGTTNTFALAHGQSVEIELPLGKDIVITETNGHYSTAWTSSDANITLTDADTATVTINLSGDGAITVINTLEPPSPTGLNLRFAPYLALLAMGLALALAVQARRRREEN